MNAVLPKSLSPDELRASMSGFWNDQLAVESDGGHGLTAALPLMYPDGWQIVVHIEPFSATHVMITDNPEIRTAMIFDPDSQNWDAVSLAIGNDVCDLFAPVFERDQIIRRLHELQVA